MIQSKTARRLGGLLLLALCGGFTAWGWYTALNEGSYSPETAAVFPACAVLGLGMLLLPINLERIRAEHEVDQPEKWSHFPLAWKVLFVVALAIGLGNWAAVAQTCSVARQDADPRPIVKPPSADTPVTSVPVARESGPVRDAILVLGGILVLVGILVALAGQFWDQTTNLLKVFGKEVNTEIGLRIVWTGLLVGAAGFGLVYLAR